MDCSWHGIRTETTLNIIPPPDQSIKVHMPNSLMTESCLSAKVNFILCDIHKQTHDSCPEVLDNLGLLRWNYVAEILSSAAVPGQEDAEYFVSCVRALSPVMRTVYEYYVDINEEYIHDNINCYLLWTSEPEVLQRCIHLATEARVGTIHSLLMCTSIIERSLGDLYLLKGKQCPSMLKDLLITDELQQLLGSLPLQVLKILIGPPISLNLRNIVWHGFPSPGELHPQYVYMLICVLASMGKILQDSQVSVSQVEHRPMVTFPQVAVIEQKLLKDIEITATEFESLVQIFKEPSFIQKSMIDIWIYALELYKTGKYGDCVCLLLPQLEHGLRRMFTLVNNCPHRILTAESTVLFTTLDEILNPQLEDGSENKLRCYLGDQVMMLLLDLFSYLAGPRLRDKISHGEANLSTLSHNVAYLLVSVCVICMQKCQLADHNKQIKKGDADIAGPEQECSRQIEKGQDSDVGAHTLCKPLLDRLMSSVDRYRCQFHPIAIVQSKLLQCANHLEKWNMMSAKIQQFLGDAGGLRQEDKVTEDIMAAGQMWLTNYSRHTELHLEMNLCVLQPFSSLFSVYQSYLECVIPTLYRTALDKQKSKEDEIVGLLHHITQHTTLAAEQIYNVVNEWTVRFKNKGLHSRQRKTYFRILQSLPVISSGVRLVLLVSVIMLYALDHIKLMAFVEQVQIVKLLKFMLKYSELLISYTASNKNRWLEASELTVQLAEKVLVTSKPG